MKIYKVGGAVRDQLLGYPSTETDWVVVGAKPAEMIELGFSQVGKDFPVFLHPKTKEEYALARTERKQGHGYHGFVVHAEPTVTLEEDLERRDLTINAMALSDQGEVIDPYNGQSDLNKKLLRHVSPHFVEDPLRVLRVARFAARYAHLGFRVADETLSLMGQIVAQGELPHLSIERVWIETERALSERNPEVYFSTLAAVGALEWLIPELTPLEDQLTPLVTVARRTQRTDCRWASLGVSLPLEAWAATQTRLKTPKQTAAIAIKVCELKSCMEDAFASDRGEEKAEKIFALFTQLDALRKDEPWSGFCETFHAVSDDGLDTRIIVLNQALTAAKSINAADVAGSGLQGPELGAAIKQRRLAAVREVVALAALN